ncbi:metallophosphoesterase family protein [Nocardioides mesophilus]|uniref:Metallophosphoesterase n=1 Tax=Nocardioides mesophilus TaxID=433659 RepID=A0A7G9RG23_9ACTN|nr:metallophosphoesterase [Nocardioides mesophilus]QNN54548.1 metallophosphoesterase [Nocardioides mesophilus]
MGPFAALRRPDPRWAATLAVVWLLTAVPIAVTLFLTGSRTIVLAGHDTDLEPTLDGYATVDLGPYLPSFRIASGSRLGAALDLGPTDLRSYEALVERYALLASQPEGQIAKVRATLVDMALDSAVVGALLGLAAPGLVLLVGRRRWSELAHPWSRRRTGATAVCALVVVAAVGTGTLVEDSDEPSVREQSWQPLAEALPDVDLPSRAAGLEVESGLMTSGTRRLVESALATYRKSLTFYQDLTAAAPALASQLRAPQEGEVVALLVSDRHDNIGMDPVARAVADAGGATFLLDAGDDTSTGGSWEAFSLDSLNSAFDDYDDRYAVAGNHDNGDFVTEYLAGLGFTTLVGDVVDGPDGIRLLGASDVRSSGLGSWRDQSGEVTFDEQRTLLADAACAQDAKDERISTLLVHDAASGSEALERGCVDLVLAGHLHEQVGPSPVVAADGTVGYSYTNGTTGGAAYAVALGSKLRRDAEVTLVTYREGRPVGLQPVMVRTTGEFRVGPWTPLEVTVAPQ